MKYTFTAHGHPNILATHKTTLEITKDSELTKNGDCIVVVRADFSMRELQRVIGSCGDGGKISLLIECGGVKEEIIAVVNKGFSSDQEIVLRKGNFLSERTLGVNADVAACDIGRKLVEKLKSPSSIVSVTVSNM